MSRVHNFEPNSYKKSEDFRVSLMETCLKELSHLVKWREDGEDSVIDIGCGVGDITMSCIYPMLPKNYNRLMCADFSADMLEAAKKIFSGVSRVDFIQLDIGSPLPEQKSNELGSYDHVFSLCCLCYVKNQKQAFRNIFEILRPGGDILISFQAIAPLIEILYEMVERPKWQKTLSEIGNYCPYPYRKDPNPQQSIEDLLKSSGFTDITVKITDSDLLYETKEVFREFVKSFPMCCTVPQAEEQEFFQEVVELAVSKNYILEHRDEEPSMENKTIRRFIHMHARKPAL